MSRDQPTGRRDPISVMLCDDHPLFRRGVHAVLASTDDIEVVAEAVDGRDAVDQVARVAPDVVLMDVDMPVMDGIEATRRIVEQAPGTQVVVLTASEAQHDLYEAVKAGARGYVLKDVPIDEVADVVRAAAAGESIVSPAMAAKLLIGFTDLATRADERVHGRSSLLTDRELEVLGLVATGRSNRAIADELFISENTVKNHVRNLLEKLHVHTRMEAVTSALRLGLLELPEA